MTSNEINLLNMWDNHSRFFPIPDTTIQNASKKHFFCSLTFFSSTNYDETIGQTRVWETETMIFLTDDTHVCDVDHPHQGTVRISEIYPPPFPYHLLTTTICL